MRLLGLLFFLFACSANAGWAQDFPFRPDHLTSGSQLETLGSQNLGAAGASVRKLPSLALDLIMDFEDWVPNPYDDAAHYCTIGFGHLIVKKPCKSAASELMQFKVPLSDDDGIKLLGEDTAIAGPSVQQFVHRPLSDEQFGALSSFVFNVGGKNFSKSRLLEYINNDEYPGAAKEFHRWIKAGGEISNGLIARRNCEAALFSGKLNYPPGKKFARADCSSLGAAPEVVDLIDIRVGQ